MVPINSIPQRFQDYVWSKKHPLFGYPADAFPDFRWIGSLEDRFAWLRVHHGETSGIYLIREMIEWGGSQNGVLQKFEDGLGEICLRDALSGIVGALDDPARAIGIALTIPGMGLSYASKLLRFLRPETYGALDSQIRRAFAADPEMAHLTSGIYDGQPKSMIDGYVRFTEYLHETRNRLAQSGIRRPDCALAAAADKAGWRAADIEMALFGWAANQ